MTRYVPRAMRRWNGGIDARVSGTASVLSQLRAIKVVGLAPSMGRHLQSMRDREVALSLRRRVFYCVGMIFCKSWNQLLANL